MAGTTTDSEKDFGSDEILIGISACLLGQEVRYDGGHKRDPFLVGTLGRFVTFVPVCPEVEIGLGTPREPIRLVRRSQGLRLVGVDSGEDLTTRMNRYARGKVRELSVLGLCGYILKKDSPSCGMERVTVYEGEGPGRRSGRGIFAAALMERLPMLPVEEEGRLHDPRLREKFLERVFAYHRLRRLFRDRWRIRDLVRFHTAEKMLRLAHSPRQHPELGRIVAASRDRSRSKLATVYRRTFMAALGVTATPRKDVDVLQHMAGHLEDALGSWGHSTFS